MPEALNDLRYALNDGQCTLMFALKKIDNGRGLSSDDLQDVSRVLSSMLDATDAALKVIPHG